MICQLCGGSQTHVVFDANGHRYRCEDCKQESESKSILMFYTDEQLIAELKRRKEVMIVCPECNGKTVRTTNGCRLCGGEGKIKAEKV